MEEEDNEQESRRGKRNAAPESAAPDYELARVLIKALTWAQGRNGRPLLCFGGLTRSVKVVDGVTGELLRVSDPPFVMQKDSKLTY